MSEPTGAPIILPTPTVKSVSSTTTATSYSFTLAAACANATNNQQVVLTFTPASGTGLTVTVTLHITSPAILASTSAITINCNTASGTTPVPVGITLAAAGALSVTVTEPSGAPIVLPNPSTLSVSSTTVATNFSFTLPSGCVGVTNGQQVVLTFTPATGEGVAVTATLNTVSPTIAATQSAITLNCDTVLGPGPAVPVGITLVTSGSPVSVSVTAPTGLAFSAGGPINMPASASVSSTTVATTFNFSLAAGCKNFVPGTTPTSVLLTFTPATGTGLTVTATLVVTYSASALTPSPSAVTLTCTKAGTVYTPQTTPQAVNVTSAANGGTPFTLDTAAYPLPASGWLSVTAVGGGTFSGGTASISPVTFDVVPAAGCGGLPVGNSTFMLAFKDAPAPDKFLSITIQVGSATTLSASVSPVALSYTAGSTTYTGVTTNITSSGSPQFFSVNTNTLPLWLNVSPTSATAPTSGSAAQLTFKPTVGAQTLAPGSYSASVHLVVSGDTDFVLPVTLQVVNGGAALTVADGTTRNISWVLGTTLPSLLVTPISSDAPIPYCVTVAENTTPPYSALEPVLSATQGLAYSFGSPIDVTFLQSVFGASQPGNQMQATMSIYYPYSGTGACASSNSTAPVNVVVTVTVVSPGATINSITPASLPTSTSGTYPVALTGTGFVTVASGGASQATLAGVAVNGYIVPDSNVVATVINSTSIVLTITVPPSTNPDPLLPFSGAGGTVTIGVCNPQGSSNACAVTSTITLNIGINPIIQAITSASSFVEATPPALPAVSAYDILSLFGTNFCVSNSTGCIAPNPTVMYGRTDPLTFRYLTSLSPDASGPTQRNLSVTFQTHSSSPTVIGVAPLLFATNGQINLVVPSAVSTYVGQPVDIVVSFGYASGATLLQSLPYTVTIVATDPGIFTIPNSTENPASTGDGQGDPAALSATYALVNQANPANIRSTGTDSDQIALYVTGLGLPDSDGTQQYNNASLKCMPAADYFANVNALTGVSPALTSDDGLVLQSTYFDSGAGVMQPCLKSTSNDVPSVTIGTVAATVKYAGWVAGSIAGLYQINVQLPASTLTLKDPTNTTVVWDANPHQLPVVITANGVTSQPSGVNLWVQRTLLVTYTGVTTGTQGATWTQSGGVVVADGSNTYTYAATATNASGAPITLADLGLAINSGTGVISASSGSLSASAPVGANTITVTVTEATTGVTGSVTFTFTVAASS
ncbi:MAG TPA: hypothetical protein VME43_12415 [Bryobacteraceae bacterium]|nr:hypothetical protein [Bryobacteraceae bacterium]